MTENSYAAYLEIFPHETSDEPIFTVRTKEDFDAMVDAVRRLADLREWLEERRDQEGRFYESSRKGSHDSTAATHYDRRLAFEETLTRLNFEETLTRLNEESEQQ